ncbi:RNA-directed DNA polymerase, eukaryota [Tanacetum coccineum]
MWDSRVFNIENKTSDSNFLAVMGSWAGSSSKVELLNIYAPQASALKEQLWSSIEAIVNANEIIWILFGDFNVVRHIGERVGSLFDAGEANTFNDFISRTGLFDFPMNGRRLQDLTVVDTKLANLTDSWYLTTSSIFGMKLLFPPFVALIQITVPSCFMWYFGPKRFKVFDKWIGNEDFLTLISSSWASIPSLLSPDLATKNKIKKLRLDIKSWTLDKILAQKKVREDLKRHLLDWDTKAEAGLINDGDIAKREEWIMDL